MSEIFKDFRFMTDLGFPTSVLLPSLLDIDDDSPDLRLENGKRFYPKL